MKTTERNILLQIFLLGISTLAMAGHEHYISKLSGAGISGGSVNVSLPVPGISTFVLQPIEIIWGESQTYPEQTSAKQEISALRNPVINVLLHFDETGKTFYDVSTRWTITYAITLYRQDNIAITLTEQSITVACTPTGSYSARAFQQYLDFVRAELRVTGVVVSGTQVVPDDLILELQLECDRWYYLDNYAIPQIYFNYGLQKKCYASSEMPRNELPLSWDYIPGAENYDLEWLFIDIPEDLAAIRLSDYDFDFRNATRINTAGNQYNIPLAYPRGIIVFRIRAIGVDTADLSQPPRVATWSIPLTRGKLSSINSSAMFRYCGLEETLNWQYTGTYAEEGKRKEMLTCFDGTLRTRQMATVSNTDSVALVTETVYDYLGRAAVQVMPGVVPSEGMKLYGNGISNELFNGKFGSADFDDDSTFSNPSRLDRNGNLSKADQYWSPDNPFVGTDPWSKFLPDGKGYPYNRAAWMNDGTGRVKSQSGAGPVLMSGNQHDTRYYYGRPEGQVTLDRLFGSEVGFLNHYERNVTIDPNGQSTVAYLDQEGRTIATALAGKKPDNLLLLDRVPKADTLMANLLDDNNHNSDNHMVSMTTLMPTEKTQYNFTYSLDSVKFCNTCPVCLNCTYRLSITIKDNEETGTASEYEKTNLLLTGDTLLTFSCSLDPGTYTLTKSLWVDEASEQALAEEYRHHEPPCIALPGVEPEPCVFTCEKMCEEMYPLFDSLGQQWFCYYGDEGQRYVSQDTLLRNDSISHCIQRNCDPQKSPYPDLCDRRRRMMISDMSPGGQYFDNAYIVDTITGERNALNKNQWLIQNLNTGFGNTFPVTQYPILNSIKNNYLGNPDSVWNYMRAHWDPQWAEALLPCHPEYCIYQYYCLWNVEQNGECPITPPLKDYRIFDSTMMVTTDSALAFQYALWNPLAMQQNTSTGGAGADNSLYQPFALPDTVPCNFNSTSTYCPSTDPFFWRMNPAGSSILPAVNWPDLPPGFSPDPITRMQNYLQRYMKVNADPSDTMYYSIWYVLFDPDHIAETKPEEIDTNVLKVFITLQDTVFKPESEGGHGITRLQFFKGSYTFFKQKILSDVYNNLSDYTEKPPCGTCGMSTTTVAQPPAGIDIPVTFELKYNDGSQDDFFEWQNLDNRYVVKFTPDQYPATVTDCRINIGRSLDFIDSAYLQPFEVYACTIRPPLPKSGKGGGTPGDVVNRLESTVVVEPGTYGSLDLSSLFGSGISIGSGSFYIVMEQAGSPSQPGGIAMDKTADQFNSYFNSETADAPWIPADANMMIPSVVINPPVTNDAVKPDTCCKGGYYLHSQSTPGGLLTDEGYTARFWHDVIFDLFDSPNLGDYIKSIPEIDSLTVNHFPDPDSVPAYPSLEAYRDSLMKDCLERSLEDASYAALAELEKRYADSITKLTADYRSYCYAALPTIEKFSMTYALNEYCYTLYYYDRAGNLIKTVPPEGVRIIRNADSLKAIAKHRREYNNNPDPSTYGGDHYFAWPPHRMVSGYTYNSLEKVSKQYSPDADTSRFWYDILGRLALSQNGVQKDKNGWSYTQYDPIGRVIEVGELINATKSFADNTSRDIAALADFLSNAEHTQVTRTFYDKPAFSIQGLSQWYLRNRIASVCYYDKLTNTSQFNSATHYSYDVHGNVDILTNDLPLLAPWKRQYNTVWYDYDLVSGKVNHVIYQPGQKEQFIHRYTYDADNRITQVFTSFKGNFRDRDARYFYYPHGPLARVELGEKQVQGIDYANTLNGWIKGVNSLECKADKDMGADGKIAGGLNANVARDGYSYTLGYFYRDYTPLDTSINSMAVRSSQTIYEALTPPLYNGNICSMSVALAKPTGINTPQEFMPINVYTYRYDQLNRLKISSTFIRDDNLFMMTDDYLMKLSYDLNGNIDTLVRNGYTAKALKMDKFTYNYYAPTNRLDYISDPVPRMNYQGEDIDNQFQGNYEYDKTGNLIHDESEEIENIEWTAYGKIRSITRKSGSDKSDLLFLYDPMGNRIAKIEKPRSGPTPALETAWNYTFYSRDAQGNIMATYLLKAQSPNNKYILETTELDIYGSSRLGVVDTVMKIDSTANAPVLIIVAGTGGGLPGTGTDVQTNVWTANISPVSLTNTGEWLQVPGTAVQGTFAAVNSPGRGWNQARYTRRTQSGLISNTQTSQGSTFNTSQTPTLNPLLTDTLGPQVSSPYTVSYVPPDSAIYGRKIYELTNHLGNVMMTVSDRKIMIDDAANTTPDQLVDYYVPEIKSCQDYYPFGMIEPGRSFNAGDYKYGFNGQEKDDEITGITGGHTTALFWEYDSRLGRRWNLDPKPQTSISDYACFGNNPIFNIDRLGDAWFAKSKKKQEKSDDMVLSTFGTKEGISYDEKSGKMKVDEDVFKEFIAKTKEGMTADRQSAYDKFITEIVIDKDNTISLKLTTNIFIPTGSKFANGKGSVNLSPFASSSLPKDFEPAQNNSFFNTNPEKSLVQSTKIWHEIGHAFYSSQGITSDPYVSEIDATNNYRLTVSFENIFRRINLIPERTGSSHGNYYNNPAALKDFTAPGQKFFGSGVSTPTKKDPFLILLGFPLIPTH